VLLLQRAERGEQEVEVGAGMVDMTEAQLTTRRHGGKVTGGDPAASRSR
jgi:hypothetical protein